MGCYLCGGRAYIKQQKNRYICNRCFCRLFEKRIRRYTRLKKVFQPGDRILVIGDVNRYLAERIVGRLPVKLFFRARLSKEFVKKNGINKILIEWSLDDGANEFLLGLFRGKKVRKLGKGHVKLLKVVTDKEIELFAKLEKLRFKPNKKDPFVQKLLDELQKKHPSIRYTLLKNIEELKIKDFQELKIRDF